MAYQQPRDLLYNDGYISGMFGALEAAQYFTRLLHFDERLLQLVFQHELGAIGPAVQNAHPSNFIANQVAWILDYKLRNYGTVVPQRIWTPASAADAQRYGYAQLNIPIFFVRRDQKTVGLRLVEAAAGSCEGLLNTRAPSPVGDCHTTSIRLNWPGYREQNSQIMTKDQTQAHNTIPLGALAARIARAVGRFLEAFAGQRCQYPAWQVGKGAITANDIILIGLIHVSQGSWQPILQLNRYIL